MMSDNDRIPSLLNIMQGTKEFTQYIVVTIAVTVLVQQGVNYCNTKFFNKNENKKNSTGYTTFPPQNKIKRTPGPTYITYYGNITTTPTSIWSKATSIWSKILNSSFGSTKQLTTPKINILQSNDFPTRRRTDESPCTQIFAKAAEKRMEASLQENFKNKLQKINQEKLKKINQEKLEEAKRIVLEEKKMEEAKRIVLQEVKLKEKVKQAKNIVEEKIRANTTGKNEIDINLMTQRFERIIKHWNWKRTHPIKIYGGWNKEHQNNDYELNYNLTKFCQTYGTNVSAEEPNVERKKLLEQILKFQRNGESVKTGILINRYNKNFEANLPIAEIEHVNR
jgi:hypothetical protein